MIDNEIYNEKETKFLKPLEKLTAKYQFMLYKVIMNMVLVEVS